MGRTLGALAQTLDFGDGAGPVIRPAGRSGLRLAEPGGLLRGPGKYAVLERRRRRAQIAARHAMGGDLIDRRGDRS
jgi:hypothetical protein